MSLPRKAKAGLPRIGCLAFVAAVAFSQARCSDDANICVGGENVHLKMTGTCASGMREFDVARIGCRVLVNMGNTVVGLPTNGTIDKQGHVLRRGGWQVYGCTEGEEPCPGSFRRCTTRRVDWQLDLSCLDGSGALACQGTLTE